MIREVGATRGRGAHENIDAGAARRAGFHKGLDRVTTEIGVYGHGVAEGRVLCAGGAGEKRLSVGGGGAANVAAFEIPEHEESRSMGCGDDAFPLHGTVGTERFEECGLRFDHSDAAGNQIPGIGQVSKLRYDWDFIVGESKPFKNPAAVVTAEGNPDGLLDPLATDADNSFSVFSPATREIVGKSSRNRTFKTPR